MILGLRTDKPEAEIYLHDGENIVDSFVWTAHRQLSNQLLLKIESLLVSNGVQKSSLTGIVVFKGPGSFTGLRIGMSVANALADGLDIPIVSQVGDTWFEASIERLSSGENEQISLPEYGGEPNITKPRK